jgi:hypothetical protein
MEEIFWVIFEILFEMVGEVLLEIPRALFGSLDEAAGNALFDAFAWFVVGALLGLLSGVALPERLLPRPRMPGLSLIAGPLASGLAMREWGSFRRSQGHTTGSLATFRGGGAFALGAALGRFVLVA